jgi:hypothetical protein
MLPKDRHSKRLRKKAKRGMRGWPADWRGSLRQSASGASLRGGVPLTDYAARKIEEYARFGLGEKAP